MAAFSFAILFKCTALVALIAFSLLAVSDGCTFSIDCHGWNQVCCNYICVSGSSCVGRYCSSDSGCYFGESCCNNKCKYGYNCLGSSCSTDSDCGIGLNCCDGKCTNDRCSDSTAAIIVGAVIGSIAFIIMISLFIACACRRTFHGRIIAEPSETATTVTIPGTIQSNPPHQGQVPPSVSVTQGYPHYPPAQYERQQHPTNPPPYNPEAMTVSEQPPPSYTEATQEVSGGAYAPYPSNGAFPSAPPL
ncbi:uncharacterized protein LOC144653156 [Oculina patagonica]